MLTTRSARFFLLPHVNVIAWGAGTARASTSSAVRRRGISPCLSPTSGTFRAPSSSQSGCTRPCLLLLALRGDPSTDTTTQSVEQWIYKKNEQLKITAYYIILKLNYQNQKYKIYRKNKSKNIRVLLRRGPHKSVTELFMKYLLVIGNRNDLRNERRQFPINYTWPFGFR